MANGVRKGPSVETVIRKWGTPEGIRQWEQARAEAEKSPKPSDIEVVRVNGKTQLRSISTGEIIAEQG